MVKKGIIAAVAVVIVVVAAAAVIMFNDDKKDEGNDEPLIVDEIRTELKIGDYIQNQTKMTVDMVMETSDDVTREDYFENIYFDNSLVLPKEMVTYKGGQVECYVYDVPSMNTKVLVSVESGVGYVLEVKDGDKVTRMVLADSNMDLSKSKDDQVLSKGCFYSYDISGDFIGVKTDGTMRLTYKIESENGDGTYVMSTRVTGTGIEEERSEIIAMNDDGTLTVKEDDITVEKTKDGFLSTISMSSFEKKMDDENYTVKILGEIKDVIKTEFGDRSVTVRSYHVSGEDTDEDVVVTFGDKGVIYEIKMTGEISEGISLYMVTLKNSSLLMIED